MKNSRGNLLITFIITVSLASLVFLFLQLVSVRLKDSGSRVNESKVFYIAEAGLNKGVWYLSPGGGNKTTAFNTVESFGGGTYSLSVVTEPSSEMFIISTGEVGGVTRTISDYVNMGGTPPAFAYGLFAGTSITNSGSINISSGEVYFGTKLTNSASITGNGYKMAPSASVTNSGTFNMPFDGSPNPLPVIPVLDASSYTSLINTAKTSNLGAYTKSSTNTLTLSGATKSYTSFTVSGATTVVGPGVIVITGSMNVSAAITFSGNVVVVSGGAINLSASESGTTNSTIFYRATSVAASSKVQGSFITPGSITLSGSGSTIEGMMYSGGTTSISGSNVTINGTLVANKINNAGSNIKINYSSNKFPSPLPSSLGSSTSFGVIPKYWREN